jgi:HK97 family phage portal protein
MASFLDKILPWRNSADQTAKPIDADASVKKSGWSVAFPNSGMSTAFGSYNNNSGIAVSPTNALQASAVYACVKVLSEDVAKLPVRVRRAQDASNGKTSWVEETRHPLNRLLRQPNSWQTPFEFWSYIVTSQQLWGNAYVAVKRDAKGNPRELVPLLPSRTVLLYDQKGAIFYQTQHPFLDGGNTANWAAEDILHIRNLSFDGGFLGQSTIQCSQEAIGLALATQKHAAKLFQQGTILTGVLQHPSSLSTEAGIRMKDSWDKAYAGSDNAHKVALLEEGVTFTQIGMNALDAQLLESRRYGVEEIARIFRVPPHKIGSMDKATFSNIEQQNIEYVAGSLLGICKRIEGACERDLLFDDERDSYQIRFDFEEMLRGDTLTRYQGYQLSLMNGWLNRNEVRSKENLPPIEGGDEYRVQANTVDALAPIEINGAAPVPDPNNLPEGNAV